MKLPNLTHCQADTQHIISNKQQRNNHYRVRNDFQMSETRNSDLLYRRGKRKRGRQTILFISSAACTITIIIIVLVMFSSSFSSPTRSISYNFICYCAAVTKSNSFFHNFLHYSFYHLSAVLFIFHQYEFFFVCSEVFLPSSSTPNMDFMYRTSATYMKWKAALNDADGERRGDTGAFRIIMLLLRTTVERVGEAH